MEIQNPLCAKTRIGSARGGGNPHVELHAWTRSLWQVGAKTFSDSCRGASVSMRAITLLKNLLGTQEICAVGVRGMLQTSSQTCKNGWKNSTSNAAEPIKKQCCRCWTRHVTVIDTDTRDICCVTSLEVISNGA